MGVIITKGEAKCKIEADQMKITISFRNHNEKTNKSSKSVLEQCDRFLVDLETVGIKTDHVTLVDSSTSLYRYENRDKSEAERTISIDLNYSTKIINTLLDLLNKEEYNYEFDISFSCSKKQEIHDLLIEKAVQNAKRQAEIIAKALNVKIVGIEEVGKDVKNISFDKIKDFGICFDEVIESHPSNNLKNPEIEENEELTIKWKIE